MFAQELQIFYAGKSNSVKTPQLYIYYLYQISYILVKENVTKCDKISVKFMQKRITFVFTECYNQFAKKPKIPVSAMFFGLTTTFLSQNNTPDNHQSNTDTR